MPHPPADLFEPSDARPLKLALVRLNELAEHHRWTLQGLTLALQGVPPSRALAVLQTYGSVLTANDAGEAPIQAAAALPDDGEALAFLDALVARGVPVNTVSRWGVTALDQALHRPSPAVAQWLLEHGADANGVEPPAEPAIPGRARVGRRLPLHTLLDHASPDEAGEAAIAATVDLLLQHGARPDEAGPSGLTPLLLAVRTGRRAVVRTLIQAGARWDAPLPGGDTLLHQAAGLPNKVHEDLLAVGADVQARDRQGRTPLHRAVAMNVSGSEQTVRRHRAATPGAFQHFAGIERYEQKGMFVEDAEYARADVVDALLKAGADVNAKDRAGHTALSRVVQHKPYNWPLVETLLAAGADWTVRPTGFQDTPQDRILADVPSPDYAERLVRLAERQALEQAVRTAEAEPSPARPRPRL